MLTTTLASQPTDPLTVFLGGAAVAALIGASASLLTFFLSGRRDRLRWLREERLRAFIDFHTQAMLADDIDAKDITNELLERLANVVTRVQLLGPPAVAHKMGEVGTCVVAVRRLARANGDGSEIKAAKASLARANQEFMEAARQAIQKGR